MTPQALAAQYGLATADTLPPRAAPPRPVEYVDATPRRPRRSDVEARAEADIGAHWVSLLSIERPLPRAWGDNHGVLPIWVESNADWRQSGVKFDQQQPIARAVRLAVVGVPSAEHAARLKAAIDEALTGRAEGADPLRHRFRNGVDFGDLDVWWTPLLTDALIACELAAADFTVFTRAEHEAMVAKRVARMGEKVR